MAWGTHAVYAGPACCVAAPSFLVQYEVAIRLSVLVLLRLWR